VEVWKGVDYNMLKKTKPVKTHISVVKAKLAKARKVGKFSKKTK